MVRIILVDDNREVAELFGEALSEAGFKVDVFTDGAAALNRCVSVRYALAISDINMPEIDGLSFMQMLRAQRPLMPYIFLSGRGAPTESEIVQNADALVLKMDGARNLIQKVLEILALKGGDAGTSQSNSAI